jgi:benzoate transport
VDDPRGILNAAPMHWRQVLAIAVCVLLNALDGFDVLSISFASPGIAQEWGIDRAALGVVLSMELFGMAAGSVLLGPVADRIGRRPMAMLCLVVMSAGMFATSHVGGIGELATTRLFTGLGIGGMLACTNAMAAEFANDRWRGAAVAIMAAGYPVGAIVGGSVASSLLVTGTWRDIFAFGAAVTAVFLPVVWLLVPETVGYLMQKRPDGVLSKVNRALGGTGHATVAALPEGEDEKAEKVAWATLFAPGLRSVTLLLTLAYFAHIMTFYFILKWIPKIVVDMGFAPSAAGGVLVWANVGGLIGSLLFSALALKVALRGLLIAAMVLSVVMVTVFGQGQADLAGLSWAAAAGGFFTNAGVVGFYALIAASFPTAVRAGGTGFVIGVGRGGAALGPIFAGLLFAGGFSLQAVAAIMALGSLLAAVALLGLPKR